MTIPGGRPRGRPPKITQPIALNSDAELDALLEENTPSAVDAGYQGHLLRVAGLPWAAVAAQIGSPSTRAAVHTVGQYLQRAAAAQSAQHMQEALQTQVDRYETILAAWWQAGTAGQDEKAARVLLSTLERLDRIERLVDGEVIVTRETLVVSADEGSYVRQLQGVVAERAAEAASKIN